MPTLNQTLSALKAAGEETRLRILILLTYGELSVSDITDILGQSQPRISRHLKLLMEAGIVERLREGSWAFFRFSNKQPLISLLHTFLNSIDRTDPLIERDRERFNDAREQRSRLSQEYFSKIASEWDRLRPFQVSEKDVEEIILSCVQNKRIGNFLDLGTGTGKMIELMAPLASSLSGLDSSHAMLGVARANLLKSGISGVDLRQGDIYAPPFPPQSYDLITIHQVLHYLDDPSRALREAARLLKPSGKLIIIDFAPHTNELLRKKHKHFWPGFSHDQMKNWLQENSLSCLTVKDLPPDREHKNPLTVTIWLAQDQRITTDIPLPNTPNALT